MIMKCPGQATQYWDENAIYEVSCPQCKAMVEFYKDDTTRKCQHCGHRFVNPKMDFGCAAYCQFAEQCLGTLPEEFVAERHSLFKDKVAVEVKRYFKNDFKNIRRAAKIGSLAEKLGRSMEKIDMAPLLCAAYLLPVVHPSVDDAPGADTAEPPPEPDTEAAGEILRKLGAEETLISRTTSLLGSVFERTGGEDRTAETIRDAYLLARLEDTLKNEGRTQDSKAAIICDKLITTAGRQTAEKLIEEIRS